MKKSEFHRDEILNSYLIDYLDDNLEGGELSAFNEYIARNACEREFLEKAAKGKRAMEFLRAHLKEKQPLNAGDPLAAQ